MNKSKSLKINFNFNFKIILSFITIILALVLQGQSSNFKRNLIFENFQNSSRFLKPVLSYEHRLPYGMSYYQNLKHKEIKRQSSPIQSSSPSLTGLEIIPFGILTIFYSTTIVIVSFGFLITFIGVVGVLLLNIIIIPVIVSIVIGLLIAFLLRPRSNCICGIANQSIFRRPRVGNGFDSKLNEFPWRATVHLNGSPLTAPDCHATIISRNFVIISAFCLISFPPPLNTIDVNVGDHNVRSNGESANKLIPILQEPGTIIFHSDYNPAINEIEHSIALMKLSTPLEWSDNIRPVCLPNFLYDRIGKLMTTSGWGVNINDQTPDIIQKVKLDTINSGECRDLFNSITSPINGPQTGGKITENLFCSKPSGKGLCPGDPGTSLDYKNPLTRRYYAIGISTLFPGSNTGIPLTCSQYSNLPHPFINLPRYLQWIRENTPDEEYCQP